MRGMLWLCPGEDPGMLVCLISGYDAGLLCHYKMGNLRVQNLTPKNEEGRGGGGCGKSFSHAEGAAQKVLREFKTRELEVMVGGGGGGGGVAKRFALS